MPTANKKKNRLTHVHMPLSCQIPVIPHVEERLSTTHCYQGTISFSFPAGMARIGQQVTSPLSTHSPCSELSSLFFLSLIFPVLKALGSQYATTKHEPFNAPSLPPSLPPSSLELPQIGSFKPNQGSSLCVFLPGVLSCSLYCFCTDQLMKMQ